MIPIYYGYKRYKTFIHYKKLKKTNVENKLLCSKELFLGIGALDFALFFSTKSYYYRVFLSPNLASRYFKHYFCVYYSVVIYEEL